MNINFDTEYTAKRLVSLALPNDHESSPLACKYVQETKKALHYLKTVAENEYNDDFFRNFIKVLKNICIYDYLEGNE